MTIRLAQTEDLPELLRIYESAKAFMRSRGNFSQWINGYPSRALLLEDINKKQLYVILNDEADGKPCGVFAFIIGEDPTYKEIEGGKWLSGSEYGTIHRIGGDGTVHSILEQAVRFCETRIRHLRIDTHEANLPMQKAVAKNGFQKCGVIYLEDGSPRIAFEKVE